jgi:hypothetical protein
MVSKIYYNVLVELMKKHGLCISLQVVWNGIKAPNVTCIIRGPLTELNQNMWKYFTDNRLFYLRFARENFGDPTMIFELLVEPDEIFENKEIDLIWKTKDEFDSLCCKVDVVYQAEI